ncbi:PX-associated-domain-containing protein [Colletotrichum navitas]|uniref:PX-associated-domain-containing protein n=1 Tax=Colletotrichum navitas TaxID=681940 RepID=A0AAD8PL44_9PEZI|nr:PX-associated-domain-containing protein [Colletotrichum navitas]KAK1566339.1 PX-associated-domain-containing protein [Colletotrichum navitas]
MALPPASPLSAEQIKALFNILTHFETYHEIEKFKRPETIANFGHPFVQGRSGSYARECSAPLLQTIFTWFTLKLPGVRTFAPDFWSVRVQGIIASFADAGLSEAYDKGALGIRKTLATSSSAVIEAVVRGAIGGAPYSDPAARPAEYDLASAPDLARAWDDAMHDLVYGDLCDDLIDHLAKTEDFDSHSPMTRAVNEYIILHLSSLVHQVLIVSPEGQYLVKLLEQVHKMVPYNMVRQTLKVGNAATMIAGMMKIFLAKISVGSVSNWFGITKDAADGMNLMQRIISVILGWDCAEFKKTIDRISKAKNRPSKGALDAIRAHVDSPSEAREAARAESVRRGRSVIAVVLETADPVLLADLSGDEHGLCLEYYAALLGMRDREVIIATLCKQSPDLLTQLVREAVAGFDPIIRAVHNKVDLSDHLRDAQTFLDQLIATSKPRKGRSKDDPDVMPTVEDYVQLCKKNRHLLYKWLHALCKNCPEVADQFRAWCKDSLTAFRKANRGGESIEDQLTAIFCRVPDATKEALLPIIDAQAAYLRELDELSLARMQAILNGGSSSMAGPGVYLARWQSLMDETLITPASPIGPVRRGRDVKAPPPPPKGKRASASSNASEVAAAVGKMSISSAPEAPDVQPVIEALAPMFEKKLLLVSSSNGAAANGSGDQHGVKF